MPHPLLPRSWLPSQCLRSIFHVSECLTVSILMFETPICSQIRHVVGLLIVLSVKRAARGRQLIAVATPLQFCTMNVLSFDFLRFVSVVHLPWRGSHLPSDSFVSTHVHGGTFVSCPDWLVKWAHFPRLFSFTLSVSHVPNCWSVRPSVSRSSRRTSRSLSCPFRACVQLLCPVLVPCSIQTLI